MIDKIKVAAYLDEAGDDLVNACLTLVDCGIPYVVLRYAYGGKNICDSTDQNCQNLKRLVNESDLSVIGIASDLGKVNASSLLDTNHDDIDRVMHIANYFNASFVRIHAGLKTRDNASTIIDKWMTLIVEKCISHNLLPLLEITHDSYYNQPADVAMLLSKYQKWRLLYDPVQLILKRNINPFVKYWSLLKNRVEAIDIRDYKIGKGYKSPGFGDAKITETVRDAINSGYKGWAILEPSLGRRYGSAYSKKDTFKFAYDGLQRIIE